MLLAFFFLAMTSGEFQTLALGWVAVVTSVVVAVGYAVVKVWPVVIQLKVLVDSLHGRVDRQGERQSRQEETINQIALATPTAPTNPQPPQD